MNETDHNAASRISIRPMLPALGVTPFVVKLSTLTGKLRPRRASYSTLVTSAYPIIPLTASTD